jgi:hypothetical protein
LEAEDQEGISNIKNRKGELSQYEGKRREDSAEIVKKLLLGRLKLRRWWFEASLHK